MHSNISKIILLIIGAFFLVGLPYYASKNIRTARENIAENPRGNAKKIFNARSFTLPNGLEIVVVPNHRAPVVTHMIWYKVGAADEPYGKSGIAHFLEHLMFKGSEVIGAATLQPGEFSKKIRALGGNDNAFTSHDYTAFFQSIAKEHLETAMQMEAGRMRGMILPPEEVESERQVIIEERRQRTENNPQSRFTERLQNILFPNDPYGTPIIGWKHEAEALTRDDAINFYKKWYAPNNAVLVVTGDVTAEDVFELAQKTYGTIASVDLPKREWTQSPPFESNVTLSMADKNIHQTEVMQSYRVPSQSQDKKTSLAFQVLEDIMGNGSTSRLYKSLVIEQKLASNAGISYDGNSIGDATIWLYATPLPGVDTQRILTALQAELSKLASGGIDEKELNASKTRMQDAAVYARDSLAGPAMIIGQALVSGSTLDDVEYWPYDIFTISADDILQAVRHYLLPDSQTPYPPVTGILTPLTQPAAQTDSRTQVESTAPETPQQEGNTP